MKNKFYKTIHVIILLTLTFSCKKQKASITESNSTKGISKSSIQARYSNGIENDKQYAHYYLEKIERAFLQFSNDNNFKSVLHSKINEQFDDDRDVLIVDLLAECDKQNLDTRAKVNAYLATENLDIDQVLNAFKDIDSVDYYPQIYIPNEIANSSITGIKFADNDDVSSFDGLQLNNNQIYNSVTGITEDYSLKNEVWVFSINETVTTKTGQQRQRSKSVGNHSLILQEFQLKGSYKESWAAGKPEFACRSFSTTLTGLDQNGNEAGENSSLGYGAYTGSTIKKVARSDVKNWVTQTVYADLYTNYSILNQWDLHALWCFVFFETDPWPTGLRGWTIWYIGGHTKTIQYRSADDGWDGGYISGDQSLCPWSYGQWKIVNNGEIYYKTIIN